MMVRSRALLWLLVVLCGRLAPACAQSQLINGGLVVVGPVNACTSAVGTDAYACNLDRALTTYRTTARYAFTADVGNTGAATLALNGLAAKTIKKMPGGITTDLATGDICPGQIVEVMYDGTNMQMTSQLCSAWAPPDAHYLTTQAEAGLSAESNLGGLSTGVLRQAVSGGAAALTTAELSGDCTTAGSNVVTCTKLNNLAPFSVNAQAGTYQVLAADFSGYKTITVASGTFTITLVASGSQPSTGQFIRIVNYGTGVVTVARSGQTLNGGTTSLTIPASSATAPTTAVILSDGTNYFASLDSVGSGGGGGAVAISGTPAAGNLAQWTNSATVKGVAGLPWVNVKDVGATGNGSTDDATAIQSAFSGLAAAGGTVYFPCGTYLMSSGLSFLNKENIRIVGETVNRTNANNQCVNIRYTASSGSWLIADSVIGLEIGHVAVAYTHASYASRLIQLVQASGSGDTTEIWIHDSSIYGLSTSSKNATSLIYMDQVYNVTFERTTFLGAAIGIESNTTNVVNANAVNIIRAYFASDLTLAIKAGGQAWNIIGSAFEPGPSSVAAAFDTTSVGVHGLVFHGNWLGDASSGTWVKVTGGILQGASFVGNQMQGTGTTTCIALGNSYGVTITGNDFECNANAIDFGTARYTMTHSNINFGSTRYTNFANTSGSNLVEDGARYQITGGIDISPGGTFAQSNAQIRIRNGYANLVEIGTYNANGYLSTLGYDDASSQPFLCLSCEASGTAGQWKTRGNPGIIIQGNFTDGLVFGRATNANADNQTTTKDMAITPGGQVRVEALKTTGSAGSKKVVCVDTATGQLYASSTGTDCSN